MNREIMSFKGTNYRNIRPQNWGPIIGPNSGRRPYRRPHHFHPYRSPHSGHAFTNSYDNCDRNGQQNTGQSAIAANKSVGARIETIIVEADTSPESMTEDSLRQSFISYGPIKKVWFNGDKSRGFVSFYNTLSVDMVLESGGKTVINGCPVRVLPLNVVIPEQLMTRPEQNGSRPFVVSSENRKMSSSFPVCSSAQRKTALNEARDRRKQLARLVRVKPINHSQLVERLLKASDAESQVEMFRSAVSLSASEYEKRIILRDKLQEVLRENGFAVVLHFLGSTVNGLGFADSDIDMFAELTENTGGQRLEFGDAMQKLQTIRTILRRALAMFIEPPVASLRCPIIRIDFNRMYEQLDDDGLTIDLSLSNSLGPHNSKLVSVFCEIEPRFRDLALIIRYWAKINNFIGSAEFSSYAITMLCVFYLQNTTPPLLPSVDRLSALTNESVVIDGWQCSFCDNVDLIERSHNCQSLIELIIQFFEFYANFDFTTRLISPKTGLSIRKSEFVRENPAADLADTAERSTSCFQMTPICCIQDPFDLKHNLSARLRFRVWHRFCEYVRLIALNRNTVFAEKTPNTTYWGIARILTEFDPSVSALCYIYPPNIIGYSSLELVTNSIRESGNSLNDIVKMMANSFADLTLTTLKDCYRLDCDLIGKWDVIMGEVSPFAEFTLSIRGPDFEVINERSRNGESAALNDEELRLGYYQRQRLITSRIVDRNAGTRFDIIPIRVQFVLLVNARLACPTVELEIVDAKPSLEFSKSVIEFVRKLLITAAIEQNLLAIKD